MLAAAAVAAAVACQEHQEACKVGVCMANLNHRKLHGTGPWGVQMTRNHMTRLYRNREMPGRSGMEFLCAAGARRRVRSDNKEAAPCSAPPQL